MFLLNRPHDFVQHASARWTSAQDIPACNIVQLDECNFRVTSVDSCNIYDLHLVRTANYPCRTVNVTTGTNSIGHASTSVQFTGILPCSVRTNQATIGQVTFLPYVIGRCQLHVAPFLFVNSPDSNIFL